MPKIFIQKDNYSFYCTWLKHLHNPFVRTRFEFLAQQGGQTQAQKAQNNEFIESELENQALMNHTNTKADSNDKGMKIDRFMMKIIVLGKVQGYPFLYIILKFDYKFSSRLLQCFSLNFSIPSFSALSFFYTFFPFHLFTPHACQIVGVDTCPISTSHKSPHSSCKAEIYCSGITSTLMRSKSQLQCI